MKKNQLSLLSIGVITLIICISLLALSNKNNLLYCQKNEMQDMYQVVENFYVAYINHISGQFYFNEKTEDSIKKIYCTERLIQSLNKNFYYLSFDNQPLESNPFLLTQGLSPTDIKNLCIKRDARRCNLYLVNIGYKDTIRVVVNQENGKYKIDSLLLYNTYNGNIFF